MPDHDTPPADQGDGPSRVCAPLTNDHSKWSRYVIGQPDVDSRGLEVRFDIGGKLVSWSIPTYPSLDPGDKCLALRERDFPFVDRDTGNGHPRDSMEEGHVWDEGLVENLADQPLADGLTEGHLRIWLEGGRLQGAFVLDRTHPSRSQEQWLLIKKPDRDRGFSSGPDQVRPLPLPRTDTDRM